MAEKSDDFIIPDKFIKQLQEFSNGGFILITFSSQGNPVVHHSFDSKKDQLALESAFNTYGNKLERLRMEEENKDTSSKTEDDDDDDEDEKGEKERG